MKYTSTHRTYDPNDCTQTGWRIDSNKTRARFVRRNRWQGRRDGAIYTCRIDDGPLTEERAENLAHELEELLRCAWGGFHCAKGQEFKGWRCQSSGYIVR